MARFRKICTILSLLCFPVLQGKAQFQINGFSANENFGKVILSWEIAAGNTCSGIRIFRGSDTLNFTQIGQIDGVCGNPGFAVPFSYTDSFPLENSRNYYRLEFGGNGVSRVVYADYYLFPESGYRLLYDSNGGLQISFKNPQSESALLEVFDLNGRIVFTSSASNDFFYLAPEFAFKGHFFFRISRKSFPHLSGSFFLRH
jgi:hypothetical protein